MRIKKILRTLAISAAFAAPTVVLAGPTLDAIKQREIGRAHV